MGFLYDLKNVLIVERLLKTRGKYKKSSSGGTSEPGGCSILIGLLIVIVAGWYGIQWSCSKLSYWDDVYVTNGIRTYKNQDFSVKNKSDIDMVSYPNDEWAKVMTPIYNKTTGEEKEVEVILPLVKINVNEIVTENLDGVRKIIAYEQPEINRGEEYLKPSDVILFDSKEYKTALERAKYAYRVKNPENFKNWSFDKPPVK